MTTANTTEPRRDSDTVHELVGLAELTALRADKRRLDELEAIPFAIEIKVRMEFGKSDSAPSLRSQIDTFLEMSRKPNAPREVRETR